MHYIDTVLSCPSLHPLISDCSEEAKLKYGMSYHFEVPRLVALIDYSPLNDDEVIVIWDRTHPVNTARGTLENGKVVMDKLTQTDQGVYTLRARSGRFFARFRIYIEGTASNGDCTFWDQVAFL